MPGLAADAACVARDVFGSAGSNGERMQPMLIAVRTLLLTGGVALSFAAAMGQAQSPLPDVRQLMKEVQEHQKLLDKVRESYTYSTTQTTQDLDANGKVVKTETTENEDFFVNGHVIERRVKKNGQALSEHDQQKESERVTKLVEK